MAGPGSGPQSCPAGLSPAGLLDARAEESQELIATAARTLPPQFMFRFPRWPGRGPAMLTRFVPSSRTVNASSCFQVAPRTFYSAPRPAPGRSFMAPRAPGAPAPLPTLVVGVVLKAFGRSRVPNDRAEPIATYGETRGSGCAECRAAREGREIHIVAATRPRQPARPGSLLPTIGSCTRGPHPHWPPLPDRPPRASRQAHPRPLRSLTRAHIS